MPREGSIGGALAIEVELRQERAAALKRVGHKLEAMIDELQALRQRALAAPTGQRDELSAAYAKLRAETETQRWYMVVQREAMGLYHHGDLDDLYPIPPALPR